MAIYGYLCTCGHEWEEFKRMDDRKIPEGLPCPKCGEIGGVTQLLNCVTVSYVSECSRAIKSLNRTAFADKMRQIHRDSPGSNMNRASSVIDIE